MDTMSTDAMESAAQVPLPPAAWRLALQTEGEGRDVMPLRKLKRRTDDVAPDREHEQVPGRTGSENPTRTRDETPSNAFRQTLITRTWKRR